MDLHTKSYPGLAISQANTVPYKVVLLLADRMAGRDDYWTNWAWEWALDNLANWARVELERQIRARMYLGGQT